MEDNTKKPRYVSWTVFTWVIGFMIAAIGWSFAAQASSAGVTEKCNLQLLGIETQLSQIQTDLQWIKMGMNTN